MEYIDMSKFSQTTTINLFKNTFVVKQQITTKELMKEHSKKRQERTKNKRIKTQA